MLRTARRFAISATAEVQQDCRLSADQNTDGNQQSVLTVGKDRLTVSYD